MKIKDIIEGRGGSLWDIGSKAVNVAMGASQQAAQHAAAQDKYAKLQQRVDSLSNELAQQGSVTLTGQVSLIQATPHIIVKFKKDYYILDNQDIWHLMQTTPTGAPAFNGTVPALNHTRSVSQATSQTLYTAIASANL